MVLSLGYLGIGLPGYENTSIEHKFLIVSGKILLISVQNYFFCLTMLKQLFEILFGNM